MKWTALAAVAAGTLALAASAGAATDQWHKGASWVSFRAGYAKSLAEGAPGGRGGAGFGYSRFLSDRFSFGVFVHDELLGKFGKAAAIEIPMTAEYAWHFKWNTPLHPYMGIGVGAFYHKIYRSGADRASFQPATIYKFGVDTPIDGESALGIDARMASVASDDETLDPIFGRERPHSLRWSIKLNYARSF